MVQNLKSLDLPLLLDKRPSNLILTSLSLSSYLEKGSAASVQEILARNESCSNLRQKEHWPKKPHPQSTESPFSLDSFSWLQECTWGEQPRKTARIHKTFRVFPLTLTPSIGNTHIWRFFRCVVALLERYIPSSLFQVPPLPIYLFLFQCSSFIYVYLSFSSISFSFSLKNC